jgi:phasin family protein
MYPFSQSVTPAVRSHMDAQTAFLNDMSKSVFRSFQQMCDLNIQLVQTLVEESALASKQVLSADRQTELLSAAAARAQPTTDKLRAYQQHVSRLAAEAQAELARVTEQHVPNTTRTARELVDEVVRTSAEETERSLRTQQEALRSASDPFMRPNGEARMGKGGDGDMQRAQQGAQQQASSQGNRPSGAATH